MKRGCMHCCFQPNNQKQKTSGRTAAIFCFLVFENNFQIRLLEDLRYEHPQDVKAVMHENVS